MPTRTQAVKLFLTGKTHKDLADLYNHNMELQVNVAQDAGEPIEGEFKGRKWRGYTDGLETWKPFRIPWNAKSEPEYEDSELKYNLEAHVEAIGMTGWDWKARMSRWVAFDFDSLVNHKEGLSQSDLEAIVNNLKDIEWVTIRKSTSGSGLHIYIFVEVPTLNHNEHAALARSLLGKLSAMTAFDFQSKVDGCGGNMWVWHRKMKNTPGLTIIKSGRPMQDIEIPANWKDHLKVMHQRKVAGDKICTKDSFEQLANQRSHTELDPEHKRLITYLEEVGAFWWWDQDLNMLVTHTYWLKKAHTDLMLRGIFETTSPANNTREQNVFGFPLKGGGWSIRRYTPGIAEHASWEQDGQGWTRCFFNKEADIRTAARTFGAIEDKKGNFVFKEAEMGAKALEMLGVVTEIIPGLRNRQMTIAIDKKDERKVKIEIAREATDLPFADWSPETKTWYKSFTTKTSTVTGESNVADFDAFLRHMVTSGSDDYGWAIFTDNEWRFEPLLHIRPALGAAGYSKEEIGPIIGTAILRPWKKVNLPLQPEYPGKREWNLGSAQLAFTPSSGDSLTYPTWSKVLQHCGVGLNDAIKHNAWAKANGIKTGADYLKVWVASLFQFPMEPLPYLFFYGEQDCGKSSFHEALTMLLTRGVKRADAALASQSSFNAELEDAILCVVEETDLQSNKQAYNRIKDWVTGRDMLIHKKGMTPYTMPNTTHWMQCANERAACPVFPGDTRITMCYVESLAPMDKVPKNELFDKLKKEAPDFLGEILGLEIPRSNDRLKVPAIVTSDKLSASEENMTPLERFLHENCYYVPGKLLKYSEFYDKFKSCMEPNDVPTWTIIKTGRNLPPHFPKGRLPSNPSWFVGNISFAPLDEGEPVESKLMLVGDKLIPQVVREAQQ